MMEHIRPTEVQKNRMLNNALNPKTEKKSFKLRYCAVAAAACVAFSTTVFADEIKETFYNLLGVDEIVSQDVLSNIYSDTDGHVTMTVKEVLSDKITSKAIVEYSALDNEGEEWIANILKVKEENYNSIFDAKLSPAMKDDNAALYGVNWSYGCELIKEYSSEKNLVCEVICEASGENFGTNELKLEYCMPGNFENEVMIDVIESVELKDVKIDGVKDVDKQYRLMGVKYSPLSFMLYGENCGFYVDRNKGVFNETYIPEGNASFDSLYIVMKDGTMLDMREPNDYGYGGSEMTAVRNPEVEYGLSLYCCSFTQPIDTDEIVGIRFDGIYYSLE